jgi:ribonuclease D
MADNQPKTTSEVQGEGDYKAARRYNEATREFVEDEDVAEAARDAEPQSAGEEQQLERAEQAGRQRAKDEDPLLDRPEDIVKNKDSRK